jgi:hypothetical protein
MNESLETFRHWFWVSLVMFLFYVWLLFLKTRRPQTWLRYNSAEAAIWSRLGLPRGLVESARRFGASRISTVCLWMLVVAFALLAFLNAGAYVYFKARIPPHRQPIHLNPAPAGRPKPATGSGGVPKTPF